jgi:hypothetical protein
MLAVMKNSQLSASKTASNSQRNSQITASTARGTASAAIYIIDNAKERGASREAPGGFLRHKLSELNQWCAGLAGELAIFATQ